MLAIRRIARAEASPSGGPQLTLLRAPQVSVRLAMPYSFWFGLRAPRVGRRPSAQARRFYEPQKHDQQLGPTQHENRLRFSCPKNSHSPKPSPVLRPVSASLRLRFRSAAFSRALGNLVKTCQHILTISLLRRGARSSFDPPQPNARLRDSIISAHTEIVESLL